MLSETYGPEGYGSTIVQYLQGKSIQEHLLEEEIDGSPQKIYLLYSKGERFTKYLEAIALEYVNECCDTLKLKLSDLQAMDLVRVNSEIAYELAGKIIFYRQSLRVPMSRTWEEDMVRYVLRKENKQSVYEGIGFKQFLKRHVFISDDYPCESEA